VLALNTPSHFQVRTPDATLFQTVTAPKNQLYYGDNYEVLQRYIKDESVDLIYLDPPFNSRQDYNVLFAEKDGAQSSSQKQILRAAYPTVWGPRLASLWRTGSSSCWTQNLQHA
jgi:hypothetical protein